MENIFEYIDDFLKLLLLDSTDLLFGMTTLIFTNSLMSAIIQDSGKGERSNNIDNNISFKFVYYTQLNYYIVIFKIDFILYTKSIYSEDYFL